MLACHPGGHDVLTGDLHPAGDRGTAQRGRAVLASLPPACAPAGVLMSTCRDPRVEAGLGSCRPNGSPGSCHRLPVRVVLHHTGLSLPNPFRSSSSFRGRKLCKPQPRRSPAPCFLAVSWFQSSRLALRSIVLTSTWEARGEQGAAVRGLSDFSRWFTLHLCRTSADPACGV